jgi:hypothetical protein
MPSASEPAPNNQRKHARVGLFQHLFFAVVVLFMPPLSNCSVFEKCPFATAFQPGGL